jgi:hypothetical protein
MWRLILTILKLFNSIFASEVLIFRHKTSSDHLSFILNALSSKCIINIYCKII